MINSVVKKNSEGLVGVFRSAEGCERIAHFDCISDWAWRVNSLRIDHLLAGLTLGVGQFGLPFLA
jgi:hypothetical protein